MRIRKTRTATVHFIDCEHCDWSVGAATPSLAVEMLEDHMYQFHRDPDWNISGTTAITATMKA